MSAVLAADMPVEQPSGIVGVEAAALARRRPCTT
jgi:hypothetical protein